MEEAVCRYLAWRFRKRAEMAWCQGVIFPGELWLVGSFALPRSGWRMRCLLLRTNHLRKAGRAWGGTHKDWQFPYKGLARGWRGGAQGNKSHPWARQQVTSVITTPPFIQSKSYWYQTPGQTLTQAPGLVCSGCMTKHHN